MTNKCTRCETQQSFTVADCPTLNRRACPECGELLYVDYTPIDWTLIAADSLKRYHQEQAEKARRLSLCTE